MSMLFVWQKNSSICFKQSSMRIAHHESRLSRLVPKNVSRDREVSAVETFFLLLQNIFAKLPQDYRKKNGIVSVHQFPIITFIALLCN